MATNDIYNSEKRYSDFKKNLQELSQKPKKEINNQKRHYYCKNSENLAYFTKLFLKFESQDTSFIRRMRTIQVLKIIVHNTNKNLKDLTRDDVDAIISQLNNYLSPKSVSDFKVDIKHIWKTILPELDEKGRVDETIIPYTVRHLENKIDKSKQVARQDRLNFDEFDKLLQHFAQKPCIQLFIILSLESLGRPQELLWRRIKDVEILDKYARIQISDHGKEGVGWLQAIDAYPYLTKWINLHPAKNNPESFLFLNEVGKQYTPLAINKQIRIACKHLSINKPITCYSFKRNGVTYRRLRGDSDIEIQHVARWTSTKQLSTYDMSNQTDALQIELIKRGVIKAELPQHKQYEPKTKACIYCNESNSFTNVTCFKCNRPLDRNKINALEQEQTNKNKEMETRLQNVEQAFTQLAQQLRAPTTIQWQGQQANLSCSGLNCNEQFTPFNNQVQCQKCRQFHQATEPHNC